MVLQEEVFNNFKQQGSFSSAGNVQGAVYVNLNWGIKGLDRSDVGLWDSTDQGRLIMDDDFTVAPVRNQEALFNLCNDLLDDHELVKDNKVTCWILDMKAMVEKNPKCSEGKMMPFKEEKDFNYCLWTFMGTEQG